MTSIEQSEETDNGQETDPISESTFFSKTGAGLYDAFTSPKWWPNWFALILVVGAALEACFFLDPVDSSKIFRFYPWTKHPNDSLDKINAFGMLCAFLAIFLCIVAYEKAVNGKKSQIGHHFIGYFIFWLISLFSFFVDAQTSLNSAGIGYAIISIVFGMAMTNIFLCVTGNETNLWSKATAISTKTCDFYIKSGLVLLATDLKVIRYTVRMLKVSAIRFI